MENERIRYKACPLCWSAEIRPFITVNYSQSQFWHEPMEPTIVWVQCGKCEHIFTEGYFTDEALNTLFTNTPVQEDDFPLLPPPTAGDHTEWRRNVSAKMVDRVINVIGLPEDRLWIDVGFGKGSLLMTAKEFGFSVFGLDLRERQVEEIRRMGISAYAGTLQDAISNVEFRSKPTVISMADVVEHVPFPLDVLRSAREFINKPGLLLISMPNAGAPLWEQWNAKNQNPYWYVVEHYHNFTRERLYAALRETGFRPIHYAISDRYRCCMEVLAEAV